MSINLKVVFTHLLILVCIFIYETGKNYVLAYKVCQLKVRSLKSYIHVSRNLFSEMDQFPSAVLLARLEDVKINNNVLYRLVRPTETGTQVESVDKMVNVVPFRRLVVSHAVYAFFT